MPTRRTILASAAGLPMVLLAPTSRAENRDVIDARVRVALQMLYQQVPDAEALAGRSRAMLVMPDVFKGGFIVGGAYGEGGFLVNDAGAYQRPPVEYYSVAAASLGFQAGVQKTSHVLFFMTDDAARDFQRTDGWEVGADAEVTFPEKGLNLQVNSTLVDEPVIGIVFGQDGFLLGASLEGAKYSKIVR